jgi:hypothetical protein
MTGSALDPFAIRIRGLLNDSSSAAAGASSRDNIPLAPAAVAVTIFSPPACIPGAPFDRSKGAFGRRGNQSASKSIVEKRLVDDHHARIEI